jgi:hypothetical protein
MKRLLEWKQRMLQSPLTRKSGNSVVSGGSGARSSERSTPTLADRHAPSPRMRIDSPLLHPQQQQQQQLHQQQPSKLILRFICTRWAGFSLLFSLGQVNSRTLHILFVFFLNVFVFVCRALTKAGVIL